ncbi:MAG: shikimate dehydrogenase [Chitinispirillaceae bacterium]|nr:shikimate dehydrogenase [Chitinispirillaceae bacterium]
MTNHPKISTSTQLLGIIGNPVGHSMSPAIHNRAFVELGLDFVYLAFRVEDVEGAIRGVRALENFRGLSVTIPHKVAVIPFLDKISKVDEGIGSVNTVVKENGRLKGLGTDGPGGRKALLDAGAPLADKRILILGSGGAARALAFDLAHNASPSSISLLGVIPDELARLASDLRSKNATAIDDALLDDRTLGAEMEKADVIIHATPVGMHPKEGESLIPKHLFRPDQTVMDIVYNPLRTRLLADAEERGLKTVSGLDMFVNQAALQFEAWTGCAAPVAVMREAVLQQLKQ